MAIQPDTVLKQLLLLQAEKNWQSMITLCQQWLEHYPNNSYHSSANQVHKYYIHALIEAGSFDSAFSTYQLNRQDSKDLAISPNELLCCVVVRNEAKRLPYFLDYYRQKGVNRFFIVDNDSTDGTLEYLLSQKDVHIWSATLSFRDANFGAAWFELLLSRYGVNHWVLIVDADELLYYPACEQKRLPQFCEALTAQGAKAYSAILLDMYADQAIHETTYNAGSDFLEICPFFDRQYYHLQLPFEGPFTNQDGYAGGVRSRVFGGPPGAYQLNKIPLLYYTSGCVLVGGQHATNYPIEQISVGRGCVLHFKFFASFIDYAKSESTRKVHAGQAFEYRNYVDLLAENHDMTLYDPIHSVRFLNSEQLIEFGIMRRANLSMETHNRNNQMLLAFVKLGEANLAKGNAQKAINFYRKVIKLAPNLEPAHHRLAQILQKEGQMEASYTIYENLQRQSPNDIALKYFMEELAI